MLICHLKRVLEEIGFLEASRLELRSGHIARAVIIEKFLSDRMFRLKKPKINSSLSIFPLPFKIQLKSIGTDGRYQFGNSRPHADTV